MAEAGAEQVAQVARLLARLGFVHAFGHVSARIQDAILITPTTPALAVVDAPDILQVGLDGNLIHGAAPAVPLETPLHLAFYRFRPGVGGIVRVHAPSIAAWACRADPPPLLHGFGGMAEPVGLWPGNDLISDAQTAGEVAVRCGGCVTMLLRGNGGLALGDSLPEATIRVWCLEDRCSIALALGESGVPFTVEELERRRRWYPNEAARLWQWLNAQYGDSTR